MTCSKRQENFGGQGFTLLEIMILLSIIAVISAVTVPLFLSYYKECCLKAAVMEIVGMIKDAKMSALDERDYAVIFNPDDGVVSLRSGKGADGKWDTGDDMIVRSFRLKDKGGDLAFGHGTHGPVPDHADAADGITFGNNRLVCNIELTGSPGAVYISCSTGAAMAIIVNSTASGYTLWRWNSKRWVRC